MIRLGYLAVVLLVARSAVALLSQDIEKQPPDKLIGPPYVTANAWSIHDGKTGEVYWGHNAAEPLNMASTTKIMTALVILELAEKTPGVLDETVIISPIADATEGSSAEVHAGERLTVRQMMYGLLLPSGNDASVALAEHFGGRFAPPGLEEATGAPPRASTVPIANFVAEMNRTARRLGLEETSYANPHGMSADVHRSSARDIGKLASIALKNPIFAECVRTRKYTAAAKDAQGKERSIVWINTNRLLGIEGYDGIKTGTTDAAGFCLVGSGRRGDKHLIIVVLGASSSEGRYIDIRNLFRWGWLSLEAKERGEPVVIPANF